jgi:hypothetical protein
MASSVEKLRVELNLIDEATALATSQLENRVIYNGADWEIGMSVAHTNGDQTATPFISLVFKGTNKNGDIVSYPVSFSLQQFHDFAQNVQRMQKAAASFT